MQIKCIRILVQLCTNTKDVHTFFLWKQNAYDKIYKKKSKKKKEQVLEEILKKVLGIHFWNKFWGILENIYKSWA